MSRFMQQSRLQANKLQDSSFISFIYNLEASVLTSANFINAVADLNAKDDDIITNGRFTGVIELMKPEFLRGREFSGFLSSFNTRRELDSLESRGRDFSFLGRLQASSFSVLSGLESSVLESFYFNQFINTIDVTSFRDGSFASFINNAESSTLTSENFTVTLGGLDTATITNGRFTEDIEKINNSFLESESFYEFIREQDPSDLAQRGSGYTPLPSVGGFSPSPEIIAALPPELDVNTLDFSGVITGGSQKGRIREGVDSAERRIGFREVKRPIDSSSVGQTWVIIHGWNDTPVRAEGFTEIADLVADIVPVVAANDRVLTLDWSEAAGNESFGDLGGVVNAATWITPTAEFAVETLRDEYGVTDDYAKNQLNLVGHSLGPYVASEMGRIFKETNNTGVRTITALDPGSEARGEFILDVRPGQPRRRVTGFSDVSAFSRSFFGESSSAGSSQNSLTANEAYQLDFSVRRGEGPRSEHFRVLRAFRNLADGSDGLIDELLGIPAYRSINGDLPVDEFTDIVGDRDTQLGVNKASSVGFEAIIDVDKDNEPTLLVAQRSTGDRDSIVIGNESDQEIDGSKSARFFEDGNDKLFGDGGADVIRGLAGDDILSGGTGEDELFGGDGDDVLYGGDEFRIAARDELTGGLGSDRFALNQLNVTDSFDKADIIRDFDLRKDFFGLIEGLSTSDLSIQNIPIESIPLGVTTDGVSSSISTRDGILAVVEKISAEAILGSSRNLFTANGVDNRAIGRSFEIV